MTIVSVGNISFIIYNQNRVDSEAGKSFLCSQGLWVNTIFECIVATFDWAFFIIHTWVLLCIALSPKFSLEQVYDLWISHLLLTFALFYHFISYSKGAKIILHHHVIYCIILNLRWECFKCGVQTKSLLSLQIPLTHVWLISLLTSI